MKENEFNRLHKLLKDFGLEHKAYPKKSIWLEVGGYPGFYIEFKFDSDGTFSRVLIPDGYPE